jgi:hypothetical protein
MLRTFSDREINKKEKKNFFNLEFFLASERPMELETGQWQQRSIWQLSWTSSDDSWIPRY